MLDILVVGGVGVDTIVRVPEIAIGDGDSLGVEPIYDYVAHTGNGVALGCLHLGLATRFIDYIGEDEQGALVRRHYERHGLDFRYLISPNGTSRSVNLVDAEGRRFSFYDYRHDGDLRMPAEFFGPHVAEAKHVHVSIPNHTRDVLAAIPEGVTVSTDLHGWDGEAEHQKAFARRADMVTLSAARLGSDPEKAMRWIIDNGRAAVVVATDGEHGGYVLERGGSLERYGAVDPVAELGDVSPEWASWAPVDSNGAGDAFTSGLLWARSRGGDLAAALDAGRVAGAYACGTRGTSTALISAELLTESLAALKR
ncbi:carbohydrate kinase family protein [Glycomyces harbinensis]|uniref:Sugar or nucleoside kinase, ribokinase family n=1 Tax=Glycomyces harbinensis TaxID=58114 RepID=A0A1G6T468_9ACTN|nr:carbohydrate kinase family protein [Glycomyces harbinensis]SDD23781.1 Sugar or nucleoside kinase, ribokinase family [Glycomyces harbinensis]